MQRVKAMNDNEWRDWLPTKPLVVYVHVTPTKANQLSEPIVSRVGYCSTVDEARVMVDKDKQEMCRTFGGLFSAPGVSGRRYKVIRRECTTEAML